MSQDTNINNLIINKLTKEQYESIENPSDTELYLITDDNGIDSSDVINALGYTPYNSSNPSGFITNVVNDLANYYLKTETYTKTEVQQLIASIPQFSVVVVQTLPVTGERMVLYLVPKEGASPDVYNEYIWIEADEDYELIGNTAIDLTDYVQFTDLATVATTGVYDDLIDKPIPPVGYGTSSTAAATATKVVSIPEITELNVGQVIIVKPSTTSTVANSKIKLNDFEAYNMRYNNANITTSTDSTVWTANIASMFIFDGTYWQFLGHGYDTNTTYASMSANEGITGTATSTRSLTATNLKQIIQGTKLNGLVTTNDADVVASDSITIGIGKLQAQSTETKSILEDKQNTLVSGTNIKTINNESLLGSGNITIQGGGGTVDQTFDGTSTNAQSGVAIAGELDNYQSLITSTNMLGSDLVDDTNNTHKFATSAQLTQIGTNQTDISTINGKIPSQASTSNQLADKAFVNSSVQTATANFRGNWDTWALVPTSASSYPTDYAGSTTPTVNDYLVVQDASDYTGDTLEGTWRFKYTGTWSTDGKSGWNPEYQVNETPLTAAQLAALNSGITSSDVTLIGTALQPSDLPTNHVTTDTDQDITGTKTFVGTKKVAFKQSGNSDKLGFTLYTNSNVEKGYLEFNPTNTIDGAPLMTLGNYASSASGITQVGFRRYSSVSGASGAYNLLTPLIADAKSPFNLTTTYTNFYLPLGFTDGTNTVLASKSGLVDLSSILPSSVTVDQTYNPLSANAQSGVAINGAGFLKNTATGSNALTILGNVSSQSGAVNIGYGSNGTGQDGVAIGQYASASNAMSIAVGSGASALGGSAIQIGAGTNSTANTLSVGLGNNNNYQLLDATGLIPDARLSNNIARTTDIPTVDQTYSSSSTNAQSGVAIDGAGFLKNKATASSSLAILGAIFNDSTRSTVIGYNASTLLSYSTVLGANAGTSYGGTYGTALGAYSEVQANSAIQLGYGTNTTANTLSIGFYNNSSTHYNYQLLDGTTGYIPNARINMDSSPTSASTNTVTSGGVYTALSNKQDTLVSGTNIKTINNTSILGSGNIDIQGGVSMTYDSTTETLTFA